MGTVCTVQLWPFHCADAAPLLASPTTMQLFFELHETALNEIEALGVGTRSHLLSSQRSTEFDPIAMQAVRDGHDTPLSMPPGGCWSDHRDPFQRSTIVPVPARVALPVTDRDAERLRRARHGSQIVRVVPWSLRRLE